MNKELIIKLATGLIAKLLRYGIAIGGGAAAVDEGTTLQTASGIAAIIVSIAWSVWEDRVKSKSQTATNNPHKHVFWGAGEADCPKDIKAPNGELHTLQCKVCGLKNPPKT